MSLTGKKFSLVVILTILLGSCSLQNNTIRTPLSSPGQTNGNQKLQLNTFQVPTPTPTIVATPVTTPTTTKTPVTTPQSNLCSGGRDDTGIPQPETCQCHYSTIYCQGHHVVRCIQSPADPKSVCNVTLPGIPPQAETTCNFKNDGKYCVGKPVIYLYPVADMIVSVKLTIPGNVTISDPSYPVQGWQNILAHPSGLFDYQGKQYHELYYETSVATDTSLKPNTGLIIATPSLRPVLTMVTQQLGLTLPEQQEFLDYWLPKLEALHTPYILFSLLNPLQKDAIDHVAISPMPQTTIAFLATFTPLQRPIQIPSLQLPQTPPKRIGFTTVEWGGSILSP